MARKQVVDFILKRLLDEVPTDTKKKLAEDLNIPVSKWESQTRPPGLTKFLKEKAEPKKETVRETVAIRKRTEEAEQRARHERTGVRVGRPTTVREKGILYGIKENQKSILNRLSTEGPASKNLKNYTEALINTEWIKASIKAGVANPEAARLAGLPLPLNPRTQSPTFPVGLRTPEQLAKIAKVSPSVIRKRAAEQRGQDLSESFNLADLREKAEGTVRGRVGKLGSPGPQRYVSPQAALNLANLAGTEKTKFRKLLEERREAGFDFDPQDVAKIGGKPQPKTDRERILEGWGRVASDPIAEGSAGVDPRTGAPLPQAKIWSPYYRDAYNSELEKVRKKKKNPNYMPTPEEEKVLERKAQTVVDKETPYGDKFSAVTLPGEGGRTLVRGGKKLVPPAVIPGAQGATRHIRTDTGYPASSMHDEMRGSGFTDEAGDTGLLEGQELEFNIADDIPMSETTDDIDMERLMQQYSDPQGVARAIREDPPIGIRPDVDAAKAFRERKPTDIRTRQLGLKDPAENISYGTPAERRISGATRIEPINPEIKGALRAAAKKLREQGEDFRAEAKALTRSTVKPETQFGDPRFITPARQADFEEAKDLAWETIRNKPEFKRYVQQRADLQATIRDNLKMSDLMEFDPYIRPQRTVSRPRQTIPTEPTIETPVRPNILESDLDRAMSEGRLDLRDPVMRKAWEGEAPQRLAKQEATEKYERAKGQARRVKGKYTSEKKLAQQYNKFEDELDAIDTGFMKTGKDGNPVADVTAWKKAGKPEPLDPLDKDLRVQPKKRLIDTFKKGRKIVNRKRGGMIKKPRGWGAARYKER